MNITYISRLFSGLANGIRQRRWEPHGVPTVCRLLEELDASSHNLNIVFTVKDTNTEWPAKHTSRLSISGLRSQITVVPLLPFQLQNHIRPSGYLRELYHYTQIRKIISEFKPDLLYFDRANLYAAALTALQTKIPVVWRLMGVPPAMHETLGQKGLVARTARLAYRAPFARVICSKDGSGGEQWMRKALAKTTPQSILLNGADKSKAPSLPENIEPLIQGGKTKVLFVSRLVEHKGCLDFVRSACNVLSIYPKDFSFFVAGSGPYEQAMRELANASGAACNIHFLGSILHEEVLSLHKNCDIYVSLNEMSNLTNANLEAMRSGLCIIMPSSPGFRNIDTDTDELVPQEAAYRLPQTGRVQALCDLLIHLHNNPAERKARAKTMAMRADIFIPTWKERIQREISVLETIVAGVLE